MTPTEFADDVTRVARLLRDSDAKTLAEFPAIIRANRDTAFELLRTASLIERQDSNVTGPEFHYPNPEHPAVKLWLASLPKKQRRTTI